MLVVMLFARKRYYPVVAIWKVFLTDIVILIFGVCGAKLLCYVELGHFQGTSYYGAVFTVPPALLLLAAAVRTKPSDLLDLAAPAGCVMLATLKILCFLSQCCYGIVLWIAQDGTAIRFPSQIAEFCNALLLMAVLLRLMRRDTMHGRIYPMYLLLYGISRFCLNLLRETTPFLFGLPAGNFWSLIAIFIGGVWLWLTRRPKGDKNEEHKEAAS